MNKSNLMITYTCLFSYFPSDRVIAFCFLVSFPVLEPFCSPDSLEVFPDGGLFDGVLPDGGLLDGDLDG